MLINTFLDTEDFVHLYYPEDETPGPQGCGAGARLASKYPRPPTPEYKQVAATSSDMSERERYRAPPQPEPPPHRVRAADLYPRVRAHYDEPGLDAGFTPICGEFIQWVGRTTDGGTIAMSNYRLHLQPRRHTGPGASIPLRLIDALEIRELNSLAILCKHGRQLQCSFTTAEQCAEWCRRLNTALVPIGSLQDTFAAAYAAWAKELPLTSVHKALLRASQAPQRHWFGPELERLGFTERGAWRVTVANADYKLCPSYPQQLIVPASIGDEDLDAVACFRAMRRIPAVVWRHRATGAVIARSSQPEVGWFGWRSPEDERLLAAFVSACSHDRAAPAPAPHAPHAPHAPQLPAAGAGEAPKLLIVDARSYTSAVTNRARGGGCECEQYYPLATIQFMNLPNIHHVRRSFQQMRSLCASTDEQTSWHSTLERSLWPQYVCNLARAACLVARTVQDGRPVLVHCSDGWDRTPQIVAAAQLILDPYYRTVQGFRVLIEREWLDFGHKFADRCGHQFGVEDPNERSPIFLQWLHVVYQMMVQYPCSFEFNEAYLIKLATHVHSCMFGTFLCNTSRERAECRAADAAHVWQLLRAPAYRNHLYSPPLHAHDQVIWPECSVRSMQVWLGLLRGEREREPARGAPEPPPPAVVMTKTRSCDNLLNEEKKTTQRRSSDPNLVAEAIKLSLVISPSADRPEGEAPLTDSCVERLPDPDTADCQQTDPFENRLQDIASNSSSLERELAAPTAPPCGMAGSAPLDTPDEPPLFVCDQYTDVITMDEAARDSARTRNISITWRSISESSNQSSTGFDVETAPHNRTEPVTGRRQHTPVDNHNSTEGDLVNHNVVDDMTNHSRESSNGDINGDINGHDNGDENSDVNSDVNSHNNGDINGYDNGDVNGHDNNDVNGDDNIDGNGDGVDIPDFGNGVVKILEVDLNDVKPSSSGSSGPSGAAGALSSSSSVSDSDSEARGARVASQLTLCPTSPRRPPRAGCSTCPTCPTCPDCDASPACPACPAGPARASSPACPTCVLCRAGTDEVCGEGRGDAGAAGAAGAAAGGCRRARARCVCGAAARPACASPDGLPPAADPLQARLHQIILCQKKVVEELSDQLREAREALRRVSPSLPPALQHVAQAQAAPAGGERARSGSGGGSGRGSAASSSSGSASEVEVGEEARGVLWLPDSAAPRCLHCRRAFWLARRRHHCRRCGGIFCSSCSEMRPWGDPCAVRVCRRCLR